MFEDNYLVLGIAEIPWRSSRRCHLLQYGLKSEELFNAWIPK